MNFLKVNPRYSIPLAFILVFLLLPTHNSGIDGYAYAAGIRWGHELIWPHHLLYGVLGRALFSACSALSFQLDVLGLMKGVNAVSAGFTLYFFYRLLEKLGVFKPSYFVILGGACFGFMRFATENETYLLPLLFSVWATYLFLRYLQNNKVMNLLFSGWLFGLGVLFHQIHGFWYLAFVLVTAWHWKTFRLKNWVLFTLSGGLTVLLTYVWFYHNSATSNEISLWHFMLRDVYAGQVQTSIGLANFSMTPISLGRTFIQVHGYMKPLIDSYPALWIAMVCLALAVFVSLKTLIKNTVKLDSPLPILSSAVGLAFMLQLGFAFYSVGNAEFMVMLPFLLIVWLVLRFAMPVKPVLHLATALLFFNITFGLAPTHFLDLDGSKSLLKTISSYPSSTWVLSEPQKIENRFTYENGPTAIFPFKILKPSGPLTTKDSVSILYTDLSDENVPLNRGRLLSETNHRSWFALYSKVCIDSIAYFGGKKRIYILVLK